MATYLLDFDVLFNRCSNMEPVEGAVDFIQDLRQQGHRIVLLTKDRCHGSAPARLTLENLAHLKFKNTEQVLATLGVPCDGALEGATGPFVLINDEEVLAIHLRRNRRFSHIAGGPSHFAARADSVARVYRALAAVAWTAWKYEDNDDADDYVQTMLVAKSFASCGGFDHSDLVARHLRAIGQYDDFQRSHGYHWRTSVDVDTFLSIAISILAVRHGLDSVENEIPTAIDMFGDDLWSLAEELVQRPHLQGNSDAA
ncbi:MAG: hypothetical protein CMJ81_10740 [Planctomycetaceae bacterium]|nr:hypothetical protein [Planctomycetaceae bacterium]